MIARLFRTGEPEQRFEKVTELPTNPGEHELLWIDVERGDPSLDDLLSARDLGAVAERLQGGTSRPDVVRVDDLVHVTVLGLTRASEDEESGPSRVDVVARGNVVLTLRDEAVAGLGDLPELVVGRSELGALDAATFTALLIEGLVGAFFAATDAIEHAIDELDERALHPDRKAATVRELATIRRRIARLRRTLVPNRWVVAALARPELGLTPGGSDPWPALLDRLERAIDSVENTRELLVGSFDLAMTQTAQRTNDVVRVLTVVSVALLPASVLAGLLGMNFASPIFEGSGNFVVAIAFIVAVSAVIVVVARWRHWL